LEEPTSEQIGRNHLWWQYVDLQVEQEASHEEIEREQSEGTVSLATLRRKKVLGPWRSTALALKKYWSFLS